MFTGIIECTGKITKIVTENSNINFYIQSPITSQLKVDQSVSHNGVCLTVVKFDGNTHIVTAIVETLTRTNLESWKVNDEINIERCMVVNSRLDGHIVQGHVDTTAFCKSIEDKNGSWLFTFEFGYEEKYSKLIVEKGSICVNGTSLTVVDCGTNFFSVAIIPYTFENTCFKNIIVSSKVNIEFDIVGKYVQKMMQN